MSPRSAEASTTAAALWQSSSVAMMPPLRKPSPLSCSGQGWNVARTAPSPDSKLFSCSPFALPGPQPKQGASAKKRSWMLGPDPYDVVIPRSDHEGLDVVNWWP